MITRLDHWKRGLAFRLFCGLEVDWDGESFVKDYGTRTGHSSRRKTLHCVVPAKIVGSCGLDSRVIRLWDAEGLGLGPCIEALN